MELMLLSLSIKSFRVWVWGGLAKDGVVCRGGWTVCRGNVGNDFFFPFGPGEVGNSCQFYVSNRMHISGCILYSFHQFKCSLAVVRTCGKTLTPKDLFFRSRWNSQWHGRCVQNGSWHAAFARHNFRQQKEAAHWQWWEWWGRGRELYLSTC